MADTTSNRTSAFIDWLIMAALFTLFLAAAFTSRWQHSLSSEIDWSLWWDGFLQNSGTEMLGAFLTFGLIEILRGRRKESEAEEAEEARKQEIKEHVDQALVRYQKQLDEQEKRALINQLSSTVPGFPAEAVRLLRHKGWLKDKDIAEGLRAGGDFHLTDLREVVWGEEPLIAAKLSQANLRSVNLEGAKLFTPNLEGAKLRNTNLEGATLQGANLKGADLLEANLKGAHLFTARLEGADLAKANLEGANLSSTHLEGASLPWANLEGAKLWRANLEGAFLYYTNLEDVRQVTIEQLSQAGWLEGATLPDGTTLPDGRDTWQEAFEEWCKTVPVDENGFIIVGD